jgi:hypothetical protein
MIVTTVWHWNMNADRRVSGTEGRTDRDRSKYVRGLVRGFKSVEKRWRLTVGSMGQVPAKNRKEPGTVAHAYNPSCSGGRDQEDRDLKPARANSF